MTESSCLQLFFLSVALVTVCAYAGGFVLISVQSLYTVATCSAHIWGRRQSLGTLSLVRSYPVWSQTMRARHDPASSYNGTVLSSEFPAGRHMVEKPLREIYRYRKNIATNFALLIFDA